MDSLSFLKNRLTLWYEFINRELFDGVMPFAVFELSNQGLDMRRPVKSQFVKYENHEYVIKLSKASLDKEDELMAFMIQQMINVYCIENGIIEPNKRYLGPVFRDVCDKFGIITDYDLKIGYRVCKCPENFDKFKDFLFTADWYKAAHIVINSGIIELAKRYSNKMEYFICPKCKSIVKGQPSVQIKCMLCDLPMISTDKFIKNSFEDDN